MHRYSCLILLVILCLWGMGATTYAQFFQAVGKFVGFGASGSAFQGRSVSLSADGKTALVGGPSDNSFTGAAWVFKQTRGVWAQEGNKFYGAGAVGPAQQGTSAFLSADGIYAIIGGPDDNGGMGAVWVFAQSGGNWLQASDKLVGLGSAGFSAQGTAVALSADGSTAIVGGPADNSGVGAVWVFTRDFWGDWSQEGTKLVGTGAIGNPQQGIAVALSADGNTALVGGSADNSNVGAAWVFTRSGNVWTQQGVKLVGAGAADPAEQGASVALSADGNTALIGGPGANNNAGAAWVFTRSGGAWTQQGGKIVGSGAVYVLGVRQGQSVSLSGDGNTAVIGGPGDSYFSGAAWIFERSGSVWSQAGNKIRGTTSGLFSSQGRSVAVSGDGSMAILGGPGDDNSTGGAWMFANGKPHGVSVTDVSGDQGGSVLFTWDRSAGDFYGIGPVSGYWVWRGLRGTDLPPSAFVIDKDEYERRLAKHTLTEQTFMAAEKRNSISEATGDIYWQFMASLPAGGLDHYSYACPTLADSSPQGIPWRYFMVRAVTADPSLYADSQPDSGYSVDNLPPVGPGAIAAQPSGPSSIRVAWNPNTVDPDVGSYQVYRSATSGFTPSPSTLVASVRDTSFTDTAPSTGSPNYYRVVTVDIHGNMSTPSPQAVGQLTGTLLLSYGSKWNLVSVPLTVSDYQKTTLFPTAVSNAFGFQGEYVVNATLKNGVGYWVKFNGGENVLMTGGVRTQDTVDALAGWNIVGSLTQSIAVTQVTSIPGGLVTSPFYAYNGQYQTSSVIEPGKGYWVKVSQNGKLVLSTAASAPEARVTIVTTSELPPPPPGSEAAAVAEVPAEFALEQNYPNPFNPVTTITFAIPNQSNGVGTRHAVSLHVFDTLGQRVATLVDDSREPGTYTVKFDASTLASGTYLYRLTAGGFTATRRMMLIK